MIRLLQRMDDLPPRHAEGALPPAPPLRSVTLLAEAGESTEEALDDWSRSLEWVGWMFSSIRHRQEGLYFHADAQPLPGLYPRAPLTRQALAARWENYVQTHLRGPLGLCFLEAWTAVHQQNLPALLALDARLDTELTAPAIRLSQEAGARLLQSTRGARYQGLLGKYRAEHSAGTTPGHFLIVWAAVGHFFQLSLPSFIAEYLRLEWDLAAQQLNPPAPALSLEAVTNLTSQCLQRPEARLSFFQEPQENDVETRMESDG